MARRKFAAGAQTALILILGAGGLVVAGFAHQRIVPVGNGLTPLEKALAAGMPSSLTELDPQYGQDDGARDALSQFAQEEMRLRSSDPDGAREVDQAEYRLALLPQLEGYWQNWEPAVDFARTLAKYDRLNVGVNPQAPLVPDDNFRPIFTGIRRAVRLLSLSAVRQAELGNREAAFTDLESAKRVADLAGTTWVTMGAMEHATCLNLVSQAATELVATAQDDTELDRLEEFMESVRPTDAYKAVRAMSLASIAAIDDEDSVERAMRARRGPITMAAGRPMWKRNLSLFWAETLPELKFFQPDLAQQKMVYDAKLRAGIANQNGSNLGLGIFLQDLNNFYQELRLVDARREVVLSFIQLRRDFPNGNWPSTLDTRIDPMSGMPIIYRRQRDGFVLYSYGANERDDSGRWRWVGRSAGMDVVITANSFGVFLGGF